MLSPTAAGRTTLLHLDHMNDHKGYTKLLSLWTKQCRLTGVLFLSLHCDPRPRHIWCILDSPSALGGGTGEFLSRLRSNNVDVNMRGQPCKERMSTVVADVSSTLATELSLGDGLQIIETEGAKGSQTHMPFVRDWLRTHRSGDAETLISAMDRHLDETTKPGKRK